MNTTNLSGDTTQAKLWELFPVPVLMYEWPNSEELNSALRQTIQEHRSDGDTVYGNGWRSDQNLETWDAPVRWPTAGAHPGDGSGDRAPNC